MEQKDPIETTKQLHIGIITMSTRAASGEYEDKSGPLACKMFSEYLRPKVNQVYTHISVLPDSKEQLKNTITSYLKQMDVICITGGTGLGPQDISPEVVRPLLTKEIPGIMEIIRVKYGTSFPHALLSRALAGVIGQVLIYVIPGSPKAVKEYLNEIMPTVFHSLKMIKGGSH